MKKLICILILSVFIQMAGFSQGPSKTPKPVATTSVVVITKPIKILSDYVDARVKEEVDARSPQLTGPVSFDWTLFFKIYRLVFMILFVYNLIDSIINWKEFRRHRLEEFGFHWYSMIAWAGFVMSWWY